MWSKMNPRLKLRLTPELRRRCSPERLHEAVRRALAGTGGRTPLHHLQTSRAAAWGARFVRSGVVQGLALGLAVIGVFLGAVWLSGSRAGESASVWGAKAATAAMVDGSAAAVAQARAVAKGIAERQAERRGHVPLRVPLELQEALGVRAGSQVKNKPGDSVALSGQAAVRTDEAELLRRWARAEVTRYDALIGRAALHYTLPPSLVKAVVAVESAFKPTAVSQDGAMGLMQLMPGTAAAMRVDNPFDPEQNVFGGSRYLRKLANRFDGDLRLTVAAYNAGPTAVARAGGVPALRETRQYVQRVLTMYRHYLLRRAGQRTQQSVL